MEKIYSVLQSTLMLFLLLFILLLGKANNIYQKAAVPGNAVVAMQHWEGVELSGPFSWASLAVLFNMSHLPYIPYRMQKPVWFTSQMSYLSQNGIFRNTVNFNASRIHYKSGYKH